MADLSSQEIESSIKMKYVRRQPGRKMCFEPQDIKDMDMETVNAAQMNKPPDYKRLILKRHEAVNIEYTGQLDSLCPERVQFSANYAPWRAELINLMRNYESLWEGHFK